VKIIPMLNPDGVIYGNYRCSLLGFDLNRRWAQPSKIYDPTIFYTKKLISVFKEERDIQLYTDIHGHSRKRNTFMYGCEYSIIDYDSRAKNALIRLFPALMEQKNPTFSFKDCSFK
jgi:murein tripeptide amidase MpaA